MQTQRFGVSNLLRGLQPLRGAADHNRPSLGGEGIGFHEDLLIDAELSEFSAGCGAEDQAVPVSGDVHGEDVGPSPDYQHKPPQLSAGQQLPGLLFGQDEDRIIGRVIEHPGMLLSPTGAQGARGPHFTGVAQDF